MGESDDEPHFQILMSALAVILGVAIVMGIVVLPFAIIQNVNPELFHTGNNIKMQSTAEWQKLETAFACASYDTENRDVFGQYAFKWAITDTATGIAIQSGTPVQKSYTCGAKIATTDNIAFNVPATGNYRLAVSYYTDKIIDSAGFSFTVKPSSQFECTGTQAKCSSTVSNRKFMCVNGYYSEVVECPSGSQCTGPDGSAFCNNPVNPSQPLCSAGDIKCYGATRYFECDTAKGTWSNILKAVTSFSQECKDGQIEQMICPSSQELRGGYCQDIAVTATNPPGTTTAADGRSLEKITSPPKEPTTEEVIEEKETSTGEEDSQDTGKTLGWILIIAGGLSGIYMVFKGDK